MQAYTLTLPLADNGGNPRDDVHAHACAVFARQFGGWTATDAVGGWYAPGADYPGQERVRVYTVLTDAVGASDVLRSLAEYAAQAMAQDAVLITGPVEVPAVFVAAPLRVAA